MDSADAYRRYTFLTLVVPGRLLCSAPVAVGEEAEQGEDGKQQ